MPHLRGKWSPTKAILRTLEVCCICYSPALRLVVPVTTRSVFGHADRDVHSEKGRRLAQEGATQRQNVFVVPRDGDADQIAVADDAISWIEVDPARTR